MRLQSETSETLPVHIEQAFNGWIFTTFSRYFELLDL
jgi:hypothetical protein